MKKGLYAYYCDGDTGKPHAPFKELIGRVVYPSYSPAQCGVVIKAWAGEQGGYSWRTMVRIRNTRGGNNDYPLLGLKDFEDLVSDHQRKYEKHSKTLHKLLYGKKP